MLGAFAAPQARAALPTALPSIVDRPLPTATPAASPPTSRPATIPLTSVAPVVHIVVTATGYQREIDECQWVRMDLGAEAPIVGAHTRCGGSVVLTMSPGTVVVLRGQDLDGRYVVSESRNAHSGDDAVVATQGMTAQVILQTCYPGTGGRERLIGLELQS